jgi:hypothetical protein
MFVMALELDVNTWAQEQFGDCQLGDRRRTRRAVLAAARFAAHPSGSTPQQAENWSDLKAIYRLLNEGDVTFHRLAEPHWRLTRARASGHYLLLGDTTTISCGRGSVPGLGIIEGRTTGYQLHSGLMVAAHSGEVIGLAGQTIHHRRPVPAGEKPRDRAKRKRESEIWGEVIDLIGPAPQGVHYTHVFDRGADNFEVYCHLVQQGCDWVLRIAQLTRTLIAGEGRRGSVSQLLSELPVAGEYVVSVPDNKQQVGRTALVEVRFASVQVPPPRESTPFVQQCGLASVPISLVEVREVHPPSGVKPLRWVLSTSHSVTSLADALTVIGYYEKRPLIEEFHKALKTGCSIETRQYASAQPLEALTALLSVVAVRLLQLRSAARTQPDRPAGEVVPPRWIAMLSSVRKGQHKIIRTVRDFYRGLAGLGGFLGRKHDGEPGWITLWRGFEKLHLYLQGAEVMKRCGER